MLSEEIKKTAINLYNTSLREEKDAIICKTKSKSQMIRESSSYHKGLAYGMELCMYRLGMTTEDVVDDFNQSDQDHKNWITAYNNS